MGGGAAEVSVAINDGHIDSPEEPTAGEVYVCQWVEKYSDDAGYAGVSGGGEHHQSIQEGRQEQLQGELGNVDDGDGDGERGAGRCGGGCEWLFRFGSDNAAVLPADDVQFFGATAGWTGDDKDIKGWDDPFQGAGISPEGGFLLGSAE